MSEHRSFVPWDRSIVTFGHKSKRRFKMSDVVGESASLTISAEVSQFIYHLIITNLSVPTES